MAEVAVVLEQRDGRVKRSGLEVLGQGRAVADAWGGSVEAILLGTSLDAAAASLLPYGPDRITVLEHPLLQEYTPEAYTQAVAARAGEARPEAILLSATALGRDLAPRLAARLRAGLASDCVAIAPGPDRTLQAIRPVYSGKALATVGFSGARPMLATLRPNVFPPPPTRAGAAGEIRKQTPPLDPDRIRARLVERKQEEGAELDVTEADIVVSGGRAMANSENFRLIRDLARALGGAVGASRAAVDAGFIDHQHQVGQTGKVVSPKLYIACGISGAIQHLAGMSSSRVIVAINKDREAPIFRIANYALVGDLFRIVPMLTEEVRRLRAE